MPQPDIATLAGRARSLGHPLRIAILRELSPDSSASPAALARNLSAPIGQVAYHVQQLLGAGLLEPAGTTQRRGAIEHHYRVSAAGRAARKALSALEA